jgi:membrane protease YdiL (CAAX protease family)
MVSSCFTTRLVPTWAPTCGSCRCRGIENLSDDSDGIRRTRRPVLFVAGDGKPLGGVPVALFTTRTTATINALRYLIVSYLLTPIACLIVYGIVGATALGHFNWTRLTPFWRSIAVAATAGFVWEALLALGEELGWRGLLVPELAKVASFRMTALLSGSIWVLFHVPGIVFAGYHSRAPIWYGLSVFTISFVAVSFVLAWLRLKSGSVWTAVIFHASHNLFIQSVFDRLTVSGPMTQYVTTEFGAGLALYGCAAVWCWRHRGQLASLILAPRAVQAK